MASNDNSGPPGCLTDNPDLDQWVQLSSDGVITVRSGKAELGQGIRTALTAIVADERGVEADQVRLEGPSTGRSPNESVTGGSAFDHRLGRIDLPTKTRGPGVSVQGTGLPGLRFARVVRLPRPGAQLIGHLPDAVATATVARLGSFLAVAADPESDTVQAANDSSNRITWAGGSAIPAGGASPSYLKAHVQTSCAVVDGVGVDWPVPARAEAREGHVHRAEHSKPFIMHGAIRPSAANYNNGQLSVWSHSQGVELLRLALAAALSLDPVSVAVAPVNGPGCYGRNEADDAAMDAALIAIALPGRPVSVQWTRADQHRWEPMGPAMSIVTAAETSTGGRISSWEQEVYTFPHVARPFPGPPGRSALLASWYTTEPAAPASRPSTEFRGGGHRNADPLPDVGARRNIKHEVGQSPVRTSATRSLGAFANVSAIESCTDELAASAGAHCVAFCTAHLRDSRVMAVVEADVELAGGLDAPGGVVEAPGRGLALSRYENCKVCAIAEVAVDPRCGAVGVHRGWIAADAGEVIDPDGLSNQLEGGFVQSASWTLKQRVGFDDCGVTTLDWDSYPILRFSETPELHTTLLHHRHDRPLGAEEAVTRPTAAAIANAFTDATGVRIRDLPLTPDTVRDALDGALGARR